MNDLMRSWSDFIYQPGVDVMSKPPIKNPTIGNVKKYLQENEDVRVIIMDIDDTTLGHRVGTNGKTEYYVLNEKALAKALQGHVLVFATDGLSDEKTQALSQFAKIHKLLFCPELMRSNAELSQARQAEKFLGKDAGTVSKVTAQAPTGEFADSREDFTLEMSVNDGYEGMVTLDTPMQCKVSSPNHTHAIQFVAPLNDLVQGKAFHFPLIYQKLGIMPKTANPALLNTIDGSHMAVRQVDYYDDKMSFVKQAAPFVDGSHHACLAEPIREKMDLVKRFANPMKALDKALRGEKFHGGDVFAVWGAISDIKQELPAALIEANPYLFGAFEQLDAAILGVLDSKDQATYRTFTSIFKERDDLLPEEKKSLDDLGYKGQRAIRSQPFQKNVAEVFADPQVKQQLQNLKDAFSQFAQHGQQYAQKYADGYLESLAAVVNQPKKRSTLSNVKGKFSKKDKSNTAEKNAQNTNIPLPDGSQIVIGNMVDALEGKMTVDPANAETMDGNGGVSGAIKEYYKKNGKLKDYEADIHKVAPKNGFVCPNGEVRFTSTAGIDIVHTSVPDLREKENRVKGSKTEATDEAKQKMFDAYYHAFEYAHLHQVEHAKPLDCPLLGAGIFKWPAAVSAEIAGRALQAFRAAYGDEQPINICMRSTDFNERFTQQNLVAAIKDGIEKQVTEPMNPSGMATFTFNDVMEMRRQFASVSIEDLKQHYSGYVASGREKTENVDRLFATLKQGFSVLSSMDRRIDQRNDSWMAFALINMLKEQCNLASGQSTGQKKSTPAFVKLCDDYLDKIAILIKPEELKKYAKDANFLTRAFQSLNITLPPLQNPTAPALTDSSENVFHPSFMPSAPPLSDSDDNLLRQSVRPSAPDFTKSEYDLQYSAAQPTSAQPSARPSPVTFSKPQVSPKPSPIKDLIAHLDRGLGDAPALTRDTSRAILEPLIKSLEKLNSSAEPSAEKIQRAREMLKKVFDEAYMTDGGEHVLNVIHALSQTKQNEEQKRDTPKRK